MFSKLALANYKNSKIILIKLKLKIGEFFHQFFNCLFHILKHIMNVRAHKVKIAMTIKFD